MSLCPVVSSKASQEKMSQRHFEGLQHCQYLVIIDKLQYYSGNVRKRADGIISINTGPVVIVYRDTNVTIRYIGDNGI